MKRSVITALAISSIASSAQAAGCDPSYGGACVPIASDVDCAGGNSNGPEYVSGSVYIIGRDIYELDR